jgi:hypothetical protein
MNIYQVRVGATAMLALCLAVTASAAPLTLDHVTAAEAAARLGAKYGVEIMLQGHYDHYITFSIDEADTEGGRLLAVNALANAIGADFNKTYIISKVSDGSTVPPAVDTTASMPFPRTTYSANEAIAMVTGLDDATAQSSDDISGVMVGSGLGTGSFGLVTPTSAIDVSGTVTLTSPTLTVTQAAAQIAAQTHTHWQTVYVLIPRVYGRAPGGTVIGHTDGGSAIVELASVYYHDAKWQARQQQIAAAEQQAAAAEQAAELQADQAEQQAVQANQTAAQQGRAYSGLNGYGYGSSGYGGNYSGNGGGYNSGSGLVVNGNGYYGNSPAYFGPGSY